MQLLAPTVLVGLIAAGIPLVVHLLLRPRARRVIFPPLALLHAALASGQRAQRVRNVWLLLVRTALVALLVFLLAGPTCSPAAPGVVAQGPVACVLVFDDSWSLRYALDARTTLLDEQRRHAAAFVQAARAWPQPSQLGLVWADPARDPIPLSDTFDRVREAIRSPGGRPHAVPLGAALRRAVEMLQAARQPSRRIVVFTDNARHAWRDVPSGVLAGIENIAVRVHSVTGRTRTNLSLVAAWGPRGLHPETLPLRLGAQIAAEGLDADCELVVREGGRVVRRLGPQRVAAGATLDVTLVLPPRPPGVYGFAFEIEPSDRLRFDQRRYVVCQVGRRPRAWLVRRAGDGAADLSALLMRNLIAPESLPSDAQRVEFRALAPRDLTAAGGHAAAEQPEFVVLIGGVELNEAQRRALLSRAERGATVLLVPGSADEAGDWPGLRRLIARAMRPVETLETVTSLAWEPGGPFASDESIAEMTRAAVRRRVLPAGIEDGVTILARYSDKRPAILERPWGRGRVVLLTTSPDPAWSELGVRAAGLLSWLYRLMTDALGPADAVADLRVGQVDRTAFPGLPAAATVRLEDIVAGEPPRPVRLVDGAPRDGWPASRPGLVAIRPAGRPAAAMVAVNWPPAESDLSAVSVKRLRALLGTPAVEIETPQAGGGATERWWGRLVRLRDPARLLALVLLGLALLETCAAGTRRGLAAGG